MKKLSLLSLVTLFAVTFSFAQVREIPKAVEETFTRQYPGASDIEYKDKLVNVDVSFNLDGDHMVASYTNKGVWKESWKDWTYDKLPPSVQDGFKKSKYADREVDEVIVIYLPGGGEQYRLRARKNDVQKSYLYFNPRGRLLRTALTI
ncbi:MAG: PepSY-like domain-containing protein [Chitinophagaceae bacterium]